ncbi:integrase catalytic domain-containing protein [Trichonephila clavata]|uniref:Integrase catalytic domain-containing protein n=1 Tax=Trichonephila clavata TaxID=2740835 RepID=A0A8X6FMP8_TRICU|nr:integrase catalytic domain-containing protein [Trichonephila clavata]
MLMIDYLSKYVELKPLNSTTAQSVITVTKSIYATHGIPEDLVSDGVPPFNSNLMMSFFREWGIKHPVTPPHFPRTNGQIERESSANSKKLSCLRLQKRENICQLKPTFNVERAREALRKRQIIQNKFANKHATVLPVLHQNAKVRFKHKMKEPWKQGTIILKIPNDSVDSHINASPKTNRSNSNQRLQVPIENYSEQSNPVVRKSSRNIVKPVRYRDN